MTASAFVVSATEPDLCLAPRYVEHLTIFAFDLCLAYGQFRGWVEGGDQAKYVGPTLVDERFSVSRQKEEVC